MRMSSLLLGCCILSTGLVLGASSEKALLITNGAGASCAGHTAELGGEIIGTNVLGGDVLIFWGEKDGGTNVADWSRVEMLGKRGAGKFSRLVMGLDERRRYFYRCAVSNASGLAWAGASTNFLITVGFSPEEVKAMRESAFAHSVEAMRKMGVDPRRIAWFAEGEDFDLRGVRINGWDDWAKEFKAVLFDPPVVFDLFDPPPSEASSPTNALRITLHAYATGDIVTLLKYSDDGMRRDLEEEGFTVVNPRDTPRLLRAKKSSRVVVLCAATKVFAGREYLLLIFRRQAVDLPHEGWVCMEQNLFKKEGGQYLRSRDLIETRITGALSIPETHGILFGPYKRFFEKLKNSQLPKHFYTIEESAADGRGQKGL